MNAHDVPLQPRSDRQDRPSTGTRGERGGPGRSAAAARSRRWRARLVGGLVACAAATFLPYSASADVTTPTLDNGGFETATMSGWMVSEKGEAGDGWSVVSGRRSPVNSFRIPAPPEGAWQAVTDQGGPGSHVLYRDLVVGTEHPVQLTLRLWFNNRSGVFVTPPTLGAWRKANQQLRIDLVAPSAPIRSLAADDVLATVFATGRHGMLRLTPTVLHRDLTAFAGQTVRLRIAEVDNQGFFQVGVDDVQLTPFVRCPRPSTCA